MDESSRPNKIRKLSHTHNEEAAVSATASNMPEENATQQSTVASPSATATALPSNGAVVAATSGLEAEADSASKASTAPVPQNGQITSNATTPSSTSANTTANGNDPSNEAPPQQPEDGTTTTTDANTNTSINPLYPKKPRPIVLDPETGLPLSRNQQKKLRRQQEWDLKKEDRKAERKEKNKAKRERHRAERDALGPEAAHEAWVERQRAYVPPSQLPITLLLDCDFDDKMRDNERVSLAGQITRSYSENKNAKFRAHLAVSSFQGKLRERFDGVLAKNYLHWKGMHFLDEDFMVAAEQAQGWMTEKQKGGDLKSVFEKYASSEEDVQKAQEEGEVIYLSSDSDYTLTELKPYTTYVIGGLVDKNREKGICHRRAVERGVKTARLPIGEYLDMTSRKVLATNHVVEIMLRWLELGDWGEAFMKVIPKRKGGMLKGQKGDDGEDNCNDEDEEEEEEEVEAAAGANSEDVAAGGDKMEDVVSEEAKVTEAKSEA